VTVYCLRVWCCNIVKNELADICQCCQSVKLISIFHLVACTLSIMKSAVSHIGASVVVALLVFVGVNSMPSRRENDAHFVAEAYHHIQRRSPQSPAPPPAAHNNSTQCNKTDGNSTTCGTNAGIADRVKNFIASKTSVIYRALLVLGSISVIVVVYISFRYFR